MAHSIEKQLQEEHPQARITVLTADDSGPYKVYDVMIRKRMFAYNDKYPQDNTCLCGHAYYRHFDPYENWDAVGCKHCGCGHFVHEVGAERMSPFVRMQKFGQWSIRLDDYLEQWELFAHMFYPRIEDYLGASVKEWTDFTDPPSSQDAGTSNGLGSGYGYRFGVSAPTSDDDEFVEVVE